MRRIGKFLLFLLVMIPIRINAMEIKLECSPAVVKANDDISCNVIGVSDEYINGLSSNIVLSNNLEFVKFNVDDAWEGSVVNNKIGLYTNENKKGSFKFGVINLRVKSNVFDSNEKVSLTNCVYSDSIFNSLKLSDISSDIRIASSNNRLSSLNIKPGSLKFNPDTLEYNIEIDSSSVNISAVSESNKASISGNIGDNKLDYGVNIFKINVTSEQGDVRVYTLNVTRNDNRSSDGGLASLYVGDYKVNLKDGVYNYNVDIGNEISSVKINAKVNDNKSSFVSGYGERSVSLKEGLNKFEVKITAENGVVSTYTLNITRNIATNNDNKLEQSNDKNNDNKLEESNNDNYLDDLDIADNDIGFSKEKFEYSVTVGNDVNSLNINSVASSDSSKVEVIGNENLSVGENVVTIKVTALNGEVREYKIVVIKEDRVLSNNNYLKSLEVVGYDLKFEKNKFNYFLEIGTESNLEINALKEESSATISISGNNDLKNKSVITVSVKAENGSVRVYNINIKKKSEVNWLAIVIIIESIVVITVFGFLMVRDKRKENNDEF